MEDKDPVSITCPVCGNINPYLQTNCMKCELALEPIREALRKTKNPKSNLTTEHPKPVDPPPPLPELPPSIIDAKQGRFYDSHAFLIRSMGSKATEIAARFFKQLNDRKIEGLSLSLGKIVLELEDNKTDTREYYFVTRDLGEGALARMAVRIAPVGTDLYFDWRHYAIPSLNPKYNPNKKPDKTLQILLLILGIWPGIIYFFVTDPGSYRLSDLEGFQNQDNQAFQLSVRAALEEAIDLAGISKSFIQNISKDDKSERII